MGYKWSAQQDLPTLQFWSKSDYPSWSYCPFLLTICLFEIKDKSIKILKIWWKKGNNSKIGNGIYFKIAGWVDLDMLHIFCNLNLPFISYSFWNMHVKIYLPCNFEVNPITHFGVIALFSSPGL
jgi:hypothetical protein